MIVGVSKSEDSGKSLDNKTASNSENHTNDKTVTTSSDKVKNDKDKSSPRLDNDKEKSATEGKPQPKTSGSKDFNSKESASEPQKVLPTEDQPLNFGPQPQPVNFVQSYPQTDPGPLMDGSVAVTFGYQSYSVPSLAFQEMPLVFGPQPPPLIYYPIQPADMAMQAMEVDSQTTSVNSTINTSKKTDLREELAKKRQAEGRKKRTPDRKVYDMTPERTVTDESKDWSRKVFVSDTEDGKAESDDLREKLRQKDFSKEKTKKWSHEKDFQPGRSRRISQERNQRRISPNRGQGRMSPGRQRRRFSPGGPRRFSPGPRRFSPGPRRFSPGPRRTSPGRNGRFSPGRNTRFSPGRDTRRISPERGHSRSFRNEDDWSQEERIVRERNSPHERRFPRDISRGRRSFSRSPRRSPSPFSKYFLIYHA